MEWRKIKLTKKALQELSNAEEQVKHPRLLKRIQCVKLKDKSWKHKEIADFLGIRIETISIWLKAYFENGLESLLSWGYKGKVSILSLEDQKELKKRNEKKPFNTAKEAKDYIKDHFGINFHLHWVQKLLKKNFNFHSRK